MTSQDPGPKTNPAGNILTSLWLRVPVAIAIGVGAGALTSWQYRQLSAGPALLADGQTPEPLPYACSIAGDCKLPGDDRRAADVPQSETSTTGSDRILPPGDQQGTGKP